MPKGVKWISPPGKKYCPTCEQHKLLEEFPRDRKLKSGRFQYCRDCTKKRNRARTPELRRRWHLQQKYKLSQTDYEAMLRDQREVCAICSEAPKTRPLAVDHCHATGRIRSLLCVRCNSLLGKAQDNPVLLRLAAAYLEKFSSAEPGGTGIAWVAATTE